MSDARRARHGSGATGKTKLPAVALGSPVAVYGKYRGTIEQIRTRSTKYPKKYRIGKQWFRRDQFTLGH